jgi:hypothetical protein
LSLVIRQVGSQPRFPAEIRINSNTADDGRRINAQCNLKFFHWFRSRCFLPLMHLFNLLCRNITFMSVSLLISVLEGIISNASDAA